MTSFVPRWIEQLLARYNAHGPEALGDLRRRNGSAPSVLRPELLAPVPERLAPPPSDGGLWSSRKVAAWMAGELGLAAVLPQRGWEALKAIDWSVQKPRAVLLPIRFPTAVLGDAITRYLSPLRGETFLCAGTHGEPMTNKSMVRINQDRGSNDPALPKPNPVSPTPVPATGSTRNWIRQRTRQTRPRSSPNGPNPTRHWANQVRRDG